MSSLHTKYKSKGGQVPKFKIYFLADLVSNRRIHQQILLTSLRFIHFRQLPDVAQPFFVQSAGLR
jgi:hypothetical protein